MTHGLQNFKKKNLRKIFGTRREEVRGDCRKLPKWCFMTYTPRTEAHMGQRGLDLVWLGTETNTDKVRKFRVPKKCG